MRTTESQLENFRYKLALQPNLISHCLTHFFSPLASNPLCNTQSSQPSRLSTKNSAGFFLHATVVQNYLWNLNIFTKQNKTISNRISFCTFRKY